MVNNVQNISLKYLPNYFSLNLVLFLCKFSVCNTYYLLDTEMSVTKAGSTVDRKEVVIPKCMLDGEKFMKWDEVCNYYFKKQLNRYNLYNRIEYT